MLAYTGGCGLCHLWLHVCNVCWSVRVCVYSQVSDDFFSYSGGIYQQSADCASQSSGAVNHAIVVVGYVWKGTASGSYWVSARCMA